jgi:hypothetical protein
MDAVTQASAIENLGPLFVQPSEPDRFWILILLVSVPTIGAACITLVRGRLPSALSSSVLLLLPVFSYVLGNLHVLEESKKVRFCGSCHETMSPVLEALREDEATLAAKHYQRGAVSHRTACYECHSGYGIWGGTNAKLAGVNHMLHTVTGNYAYPLVMRGPFDIDSCLDCHAGSKPFREAVVHQDADIQRMLIDREMGCTGSCHPAAHPPEALRGVQAWRASR